ncbi:hypothetical protein BATDEDRAFT_26518 [Batrachochytrium dendrobatidis JAM81]|uniref:Uncharacterized protein n=1 Tax=Batrachochytrium dendrobatidis (strain JAM81 / FGSC 10211) TaxID=684364 RepID=F4P7Y8_BATDJ|nr:uncharacterized protein BATDEDRAFT_26518 [Batrachochytrium dendrobatidis JAM81]EGF78656.1 hypothetical protein BATDEDRAFT_26518 [Batrachochytrium dendrobatidis JAM81]|eukprot:XP_006680689.1 hypothetical protein BATDEDRAFT_26518 [Batrachochytrium dendrobatidis JAM81]
MGDKQQHTSDRPQYPSEPFNINSNQINGDRIQPRKSSLTFSPATMSGLKSIGEQQQKQQSTPPLLQQMPYRRPTNDKSSYLNQMPSGYRQIRPTPVIPLPSPPSTSSQIRGSGSSQRPATPPNAASRSQSHYPSSPSISSPLLSESFADQPNSKYSITVESTTTMSNLSALSQNDLLAEARRLTTELNAKDRLLHDLKVKQNWLASEVVVLKSSGATEGLGIDHSQVFDAVLKHNDKTQMDPFKMKLIQSLMHFRAELKKAKDAIAWQETTLMDLGKKHTLTEDEAAYLRSLVDARRKTPGGSTSEMESRRVAELENSLRETSSDLTKVQAKVRQWAKASKHNQEGRILAEACQKTTMQELAQVRIQLEKSKESEAILRKRLEDTRKTQSQHADLMPRVMEQEKSLDAKEAQIGNLQDAYVTVDALEQETTTLQDQLNEKSRQIQSYEERIDQLDKETKTLLQKNGSSQAELISLKKTNTQLQTTLTAAVAKAKTIEIELTRTKEQLENAVISKSTDNEPSRTKSSPDNAGDADSDADTEADTSMGTTLTPSERSLPTSSRNGNPASSSPHALIMASERKLNRDSKEFHIKVGDLQMENASLVSSNAKLQQELISANEALSNLTEAHQMLQINHQELQWNHEEACERFQLYKERSKNPNSADEKDTTEETTQLKANIKDLEKELSLSKSALEVAEKKMLELEHSVETLTVTQKSMAVPSATTDASVERNLVPTDSTDANTQVSTLPVESKTENTKLSKQHAVEMTKAQFRIDELEKHIADAKKWNEQDALRWKEDVFRLEDLNDQNLERLDTLEEELFQKSQLVLKLEEKLDLASIELDRLNSEMANVERGAKTSENTTDDHVSESDSLKAEIETLRNEIDSLQSQLDENRMTSISYIEQLSTKDAQFSEIESMLQESEAQLDQSLANLKVRETELAQLQQQLDEVTRAHDSEYAHIKGQHLEATRQSEILSEKVATHTKHSESLQQSLDQGQVYITELETKLQSEINSVEQLRSQITALQQKAEAASTNVSRSLDDASSSAKTSTLDAGNTVSSTEIAEKERQISELTSRITQLEKRIRELSGDLAEVTAANHTAFADIDALKAKLAQAQTERDALENENQEHASHIKSIMMDANAREQHIRHLTGQLEENTKSVGELDELHGQIKSRDEQITVFQQDIAEHKMTLSDLTSQLKDRDEQITVLNQSILEHETSLKHLTSQIQERDTQVEALNAAHKERAILPVAVETPEPDPAVALHLSTIDELKSQLDTKDQHISHASKQLEDLALAKAEVEAGAAAYATRVQELETKLATVHDEKAAQETTTRSVALPTDPNLTQLVDDLKAELEDRDNTIELLEQSLQQIQTKEEELLSQLQQNMNAANPDEAIQAELQQVRQQLDLINSELTDKENAIVTLKQDLDMQSSINGDNVKMIETYEIEILSLRSAVNAHGPKDGKESEVETLHAELAKSYEKIAALQSSIADSEEDIKKLQAMVSQAQMRIEELENDNTQYLTKISKLGERLAQADAQRRQTLDPTAQQATAAILKASQQQADDFTATIEELNVEVKNAYGKVAALLTEKSRMADQIEDLEEEKHGLQRKYQQMATQLEELKQGK